MPQPRKPTVIHVLSGSAAKNPDRMKLRENEPKDDREIGEPSKKLTIAERNTYNEIIETAVPGVFKRTDKIAVENAAKILVKIRNNKCNSADQNLFFKFLASFGMTPADRSRVSMSDKQKTNKFDD